MMETFLKQYRVTIKTCGPVFIGSGQQIGKKEYLFDQRNGRISVVDINKMYAYLSQHGLSEDFESYLLNPYENNLFNFVRNHGIDFKDTESWTKYTMTAGDAEQNAHSVMNIDCFVKDAYGKPYIPGSSIKGMLRTMIETVWFLDHPGDQKVAQNQLIGAYHNSDKRNRYLQDEEQQMRQMAFHRDLYPDSHGQSELKNIKNDFMRGVIVSDSESVDFSDLTLCQKIDMKPDGTFKKLNNMRECIRPGAEIRFMLTIDSAICPYTFKDLMNINKEFYTFYKRIFVSRFKDPVGIHGNGNSTTFFLGGGTGYVSKTDTYGVTSDDIGVEVASTIINNTLPYKVQKQHGHDKDRVYGVSPHTLKCTRYQGNYYQMGACCLTKYHLMNKDQ